MPVAFHTGVLLQKGAPDDADNSGEDKHHEKIYTENIKGLKKMQELLSFFVADVFSPTMIVMAVAVALLFAVIYLYSGALSNIILPKFGYAKYSEYLPFGSIYSDNATIGLLDGSVVRAYEISGVQTSMHDDATKQRFLELRAQLLNQIGDPSVTIRFFMIRDSAGQDADHEFDQPVLQKISDKWNTQGLKIFKNSHYAVIGIRGAGAIDKIIRVSNYFESILAVYKPVLLKHNSVKNFASLYARILSPVSKPSVFRTDANMSMLMTADEMDFGRDGIVGASHGPLKKYLAMVSFKISPDFMNEDFFDAIGTIQTEMVCMNAFNVLGTAKTETIIRQKIASSDSNQNDSEEVAAQQISEALYSMDENVTGSQSLADYYPLFALSGDTREELALHIAELNKICAGFGVSPVTESSAAKASWFSMLPGFDVFPRSFKLLSMTAATSFPLSSAPIGVANSDWGPGPLVVFPTSQGTPYQFQFHVSEAPAAVAHTLTIGPTGGGKTTLFSFLIAQSLRHQKLKTFFFDRNRGAEIFTLATGGKYLTFNTKSKDKVLAGFETSLNPFKLEDTDANRAFLRRWLMMISGQNDPESLDEIARAVSVNFDYLDEDQRMLKNLWTSNFASGGKMRTALKQWVDDLQYGNVFNEDKDTLDLFSRLTTFDFTEILQDEALAPAVISYILHRINTSATAAGNPALIMIDETAPMLENKMFRDNFIIGLQEGRKNRQAYMAAFQRANVLDKLGIGDVVRGQAQTVLFFRNPAADIADYEHWKLNPLEMAFILGKAYPNLRRAVLLSRPVTGESVILNTELGGLGSLLRLFESGRPSVLLAEELYKQFGNQFVEEYLRKTSV
jgi:type IV secretion system protein VirB4